MVPKTRDLRVLTLNFWGTEAPLDRRIDVRVSRLRQTLRDDARAPLIIKTVYGEGYIIGVAVERIERRP